MRRVLPIGVPELAPDGDAFLWRTQHEVELWSTDGKQRARAEGGWGYLRTLDRQFSPSGNRAALLVTRRTDGERSWPHSWLAVVDVSSGKTVTSTDLGPLSEATMDWYDDRLFIAGALARRSASDEAQPALLVSVSPEGDVRKAELTEPGPAEHVRMSASHGDGVVYVAVGTEGREPRGPVWACSAETFTPVHEIDVGAFHVLDLKAGPVALAIYGHAVGEGPHELKLFRGNRVRSLLTWPWSARRMLESPRSDVLLMAGLAPRDDWRELYAVGWHELIKRFELRVP